jgi:hypothetical protein
MKTLISITAALIASAGLLLASCNRQSDTSLPSVPATGDHETAAGGVDGTVESYDNGTLVVTDKAGKQSRFEVGKAVDVEVGDGGVKVNVGGRRLRGADLKKGVRVRVNTNDKGDIVSVTAGDDTK